MWKNKRSLTKKIYIYIHFSAISIKTENEHDHIACILFWKWILFLYYFYSSETFRRKWRHHTQAVTATSLHFCLPAQIVYRHHQVYFYPVQQDQRGWFCWFLNYWNILMKSPATWEHVSGRTNKKNITLQDDTKIQKNIIGSTLYIINN